MSRRYFFTENSYYYFYRSYNFYFGRFCCEKLLI